MEIFVNTTSTNPELPVVIWNKSRILKWDDFKKNADSEDKASAVSAIGFESEPIIEYTNTGSKFKFKILEMKFNAIFIPNFSWVMKNIRMEDSALLLKHEQGHFDLAEEITRKTRIKTANYFKNRTFAVKGKNKDNAKKEAILQANKIRKGMDRKLQNELNSQETKYDETTNHGLIINCQEKYNKRFKKLRE